MAGFTGNVQKGRRGFTTVPLADRLKRNIRVRGECHEWTAARNPAGYGKIGIGGKGALVHRVTYELARGPIPDGLVIDHLCRNRACVNPEHLEPVTHDENCRRAPTAVTTINRQKTHCLRGHPLAGGNLYTSREGHRSCRECRRNANLAYEARGRDQAK